MKVIDFPELYILWVRQCVTSPQFSLVINGEMHGYFPGKRGMRQGDPLSHYLFLIVLEAFLPFYKPRLQVTTLFFTLNVQILVFLI